MKIVKRGFLSFWLAGVFLFIAAATSVAAPSNPLTNYKSGISLGVNGTDGIDYVFERWYHDPLIDDHGVVYIKSDVPIGFSHNERNTNSQGVPSIGVIRYKVDRDLGYNDLWSLRYVNESYGFNLLPEFTNAFAFDDLTYGPDYPSVPVVGTTGPVPGTTNGASFACYRDHWYRGLNDAYGNEWHIITVGDDDTALMDEGYLVDKNTNMRMCGSDGKIHYFIVNPVTPALWLSSTDTNAQWYTTPPKAYFIPKLHEQTSYLTDGVKINMANIMSGASVYYRIDGGSYQVYSAPINIDSLSDGEHLLECYYNASNVLQRTFVKNPGFPSDEDQFADGSGHGYLLWKDDATLEGIRNRLIYNTETNALSEKLNIRYDTLRSNTSEYANGMDWFADQQNLGERLAFTGFVHPMTCALIAKLEGLDQSVAYAQAAKNMLLENELSIDPVGYELDMNFSVVPSHRERVGLGYYNGKSMMALGHAYDLLIDDFRAPAYAGGFTAIEDLKVRDMMAANVLLSLHDRQGMLYHPGMGITMASRNIFSMTVSMAMPSYCTPYYGTSGFDGNTNAATWLPFPDQAATWKELFYEDSVAPSLYPNQTFGMNVLAQELEWDLPSLPGSVKEAGTMDGNIKEDGISNYPDGGTAYHNFHQVGGVIGVFANTLRIRPGHGLDTGYLDRYFAACIDSNQPIDTVHNKVDGFYPNPLVCNERFPEVAERAIDRIFYGDSDVWTYAASLAPYVVIWVNEDWQSDTLPPSADFVATPSFGSAPLTVSFRDISVGNITNRLWDFGDGSTTNTTATTLTHVYSAVGDVSVSLTVSGSEGVSTNSKPNMIAVSEGAGNPGMGIISVSIGEGTQRRADMSATDYAGAPGVRTNNWNNMVSMNNSAIDGNPVYADGTLVGGTFQAVLTTPRATSFATTTLINDARMYYGGNELRDGEANSVTLSGIPFASYDIYVYFAPPTATRGGSVTIGSTTFYNRGIANPADDGTGYVKITSTTYNSADPSTVAQGNYAKFEGLSGSSQTINSAALYMGDATAHRYKIAGFQIVAGGSPTNAPAPFSVTAGGSLGIGTDVINWTTESGYTYSVYYSTNLLDGFLPLQTGLVDTVTGMTNTINASPVFYKIEAQW